MTRIKNLELSSRFLLAPLAGVTDVAFRSLARRFGAGLSYTEMVSCKGLNYKNENSFDLLKTAENEKPCAVQLFGGDEKDFEKTVKSGAIDKFDLIDVNMGCPVPKVVKNHSGSALMLDEARAERIIKTLVKNTDKPVTVKFRKGYDERNVNAVDFAKMCEQAGASMVTVHGRTKEQMYSGKADWDIIEKVKSAVKIPVCGNGDVYCKDDAERMLKKTGCDFVMVARGALGKPFIFAELNESNITYDLFEVIKEHFDGLKAAYSEEYSALNMRKHLCWYLKGFKGAAKLRGEVNAAKSEEDILNLLSRIKKEYEQA